MALEETAFKISAQHHSQLEAEEITPATSTSEASTRSEEELFEPDAATALADLRPTDTKMNPQPSGHRRRRSSMMNSLDTSSRAPRAKRSPRSATFGGDSKLGDRGSDDDSRSTSDDMELNNFSEEGDLQDDEETGLTAKSKAKRKKKKIRNQSMDQRVEEFDERGSDRTVVYLLTIDIYLQQMDV
ncbi:hypothetical protein EYC84_005658 [Monilinia fructicola]|uniref:Uncharacterized protein n=1 Tax=Monilinia fructicola TaxID=38448 RepID=A0A5M9JZR9_MONFR|nr:hypothetical protein EYC84_005658 [Monilinia fructicola]